MFCPAWLMIVSTAMAVLPTPRSPMISSRWPRPIGIIESIDFMPVCIGSCTDLRMMSLISAARMSMAGSSWGRRSLRELIAERAELGAGAAVVDHVADAGDDAAEQRGVDLLGDDHLLAGQLLELGRDRRELRGG